MSVPCFTGTKLKIGDKTLDQVFYEKIKGKKLTETEQRQIGVDVALEYHKQLHKELEGFKLKVNPEYKKVSYIKKDNTAKIKEIEDRYNKLIEEKGAELPGTASKGKTTPITVESPKVENTPVKEKPQAGQGAANEQLDAPKRIVHADTKELRKEYGMDEYVKKPETFDEWDAQAEAKIKSGYNVSELLDKMERGEHVPDKIEQRILGKYIDAISKEVDKDPSNKNIEKFRRAVDLSDRVAGSEAGRTLASRKGAFLDENNLAMQLLKEMESSGVLELTDQQKADVNKEFSDIKDANIKYQEQVTKLEAENIRLRAEQELKKTLKQPKVKRDFASQRSALLDDLKAAKLKHEQWLRDNGIVKSGFSGKFVLTTDMAKIIGKLFKTYAEEGFSKLDDIVTAIHDQVKDIFETISKDDIISVIAGEYNEKKPTRTDLSIRLQNLRTQAKQIRKAYVIINSGEPVGDKAIIERNQKLKALFDEINDFHKNNPESENIPIEDIVKDGKKLLTQITRIKNESKKIEEDIANGNFEKKERPKPLLENEEIKKKFPLLYKQTVEAKNKLMKLREQREIRRMSQEYNRRSARKRFIDNTLEVLNVPRTVMASMDYSAPLRQAAVATAAYPSIAGSASIEMFKQSVSQKRFDNWFLELKDSERYSLMEKSGLAITDPHDYRLEAKEEQFMNNLAERIPFIGKLIKGSERAYVGYLNKMRVDIFNRFTDEYESHGRTIHNDPELYKGLAKYINAITGRGNLGEKYEAAAPILNTFLFSPRLIASRLNLLNPYFYYKLPKPVRVEAIKSMAKFIGLGLTVLTLASLGGADTEKDPRSSDFGKIKSGNTRWDIWGGFQQYVRLFTQLLTGQRKSTRTGVIQSLDGTGTFGESRADLLGRFVRGKLAPVPSAAWDFISGRTQSGAKTEVLKEASDRLLPLVFSDLKDAIDDKGIRAIFTVGLPSIFGVGTQTYTSGDDRIDVKEIMGKRRKAGEPKEDKRTDAEIRKAEKESDDYEKNLRQRAAKEGIRYEYPN